jgi:hypothetical protein
MSKPKIEVGTTHQFVLIRGFTEVGAHAALVGADGTKRLFAELFADPDRPDVRPAEAYQAILTSMQPGWTLRLLQLFWPDPIPREAFYQQVNQWQDGKSEGLPILRQGLLLSIQQSPLPFSRRTILEFVFPGEEGLAWWDGISGICQGFGVRAQPLAGEEIQRLVQWIFNPALA